MKYFVFDVDGTLMNSAAVDQQCLKQTLHEFGRDYTFEELRPSFGKPGRQTLADLGFTGETAERIMDRWEGLSKERASEVLAFDGIEALLRELHSVDPEAAARLHPADEKRIIRALEVWQETGRTITEHNRETQKIPPRYAPVWLGLDFTNRADLYARIDRRVEQMLEQGLLAAATALCQQRSRNYAKRQLTWFRRNPAMHWIFQPAQPDADAVFAAARQEIPFFAEEI